MSRVFFIQKVGGLRNCQQDGHAGFTLVEVLVAMLVSSIFVGITMQALVTAAAFRSRADQYDSAVSWIQEDFEAVVNQATQYESTAFPYSSRCGATAAANGIAAGFLSDSAEGLGGSTATIGPRTFGDKSYVLNRVGDFDNSPDPLRLLQLTYTVTPEQGGAPLATVITEVIPHAVFRCPLP